MPLVIVPILWGLYAYTAGSINWAYPVARRYGVDILRMGNRNPGTANVFRVVGPLPGVMVYLADMLTATAVVAPTHWLPLSDTCMLVASGMVVLGTMFPVFSHFRGWYRIGQEHRCGCRDQPFGAASGVASGALRSRDTSQCCLGWRARPRPCSSRLRFHLSRCRGGNLYCHGGCSDFH